MAGPILIKHFVCVEYNINVWAYYFVVICVFKTNGVVQPVTMDVTTQCDDSCTSPVEPPQPPVIKFSTAANGRFYVGPALYCAQPPPPPPSYAIADQFTHPPPPLPRSRVVRRLGPTADAVLRSGIEI